ncbi:MAG: hypothetical protein LBJ72_08340 [Dysgonamonadaceae bacterium]|nr:hypothetical protein [Dysgonamonadaceae bacterium]
MIKQFNQLLESMFALFLIDPYYILTNEIGIEVPGIRKKQKDFLSLFHNEHTKVVIIGDKWIDIEFFEEYESEVEIEIQNSKMEKIYTLKTFTVPTLHIVVETCDWLDDVYTISIKNENFKFLGDFVLGNSVVLKSQKIETN